MRSARSMSIGLSRVLDQPQLPFAGGDLVREFDLRRTAVAGLAQRFHFRSVEPAVYARPPLHHFTAIMRSSTGIVPARERQRPAFPACPRKGFDFSGGLARPKCLVRLGSRRAEHHDHVTPARRARQLRVKVRADAVEKAPHDHVFRYP